MPGGLVIKSEPTGATVLLDGVEMGITLLNIPEIVPGDYELTIRKNDYNDKTITVTVEPEKTETIGTELISLTGNIYINSLTDRANVYLDGKRFYPQNSRLNDIPVGLHTLVIQKDRYVEKSLSITIEAGKTKYENGKLEMAVFHIPYADIKIDGKLDDWVGIKPFFTDPIGDTSKDFPGIDIISGYIAKNNSKLFIRMDFSDGKPQPGKKMIYELFLQIKEPNQTKIDHSNNKEIIEIRIQNETGNKYIATAGKIKNNDGRILSNNGKLFIGENYFEAEFSLGYKLSNIPSIYLNSDNLLGQMHCWQGNPIRKFLDHGEVYPISFTDK